MVMQCLQGLILFVILPVIQLQVDKGKFHCAELVDCSYPCPNECFRFECHYASPHGNIGCVQCYYDITPVNFCTDCSDIHLCIRLCSTNCEGRWCDKDTGFCYECVPGKTGDFCDKDCPDTYYGQNCTYRCNTSCLDQLCDKATGVCDQCPPGKTGDLCDQACSDTYYGPRCTERCSHNCTDQLCNKVTGVCDLCLPGKTGDLCSQDCPQSTYGQNCLQTCDTNCLDQRCNSATGICNQCPPGRTGDTCDQDCPHPKYGQDCLQTCSNRCLGQRCSPENGICQQCPPGRIGNMCDQDCPDTYYGQNCAYRCNNSCADRLCDKATSVCDQCPPGKTGDLCDQACSDTYYGPRCTERCSHNCTDQLCNMVTGVCDRCPPGKTGDLCSQDCPDTYYGQNCTYRCNTRCVDRLCDKAAGVCDQCPPGKTGDLCDQDCPPTTYGARCSEVCSDNCLNQNCDAVTGVCLQCQEGFVGDHCEEERCPLGFCKNGGKCTGKYLCDCSSTDFFGDMCQYTREEIPVKYYNFIAIVDNTVITTSGSLTAYGDVTLDRDGGDVYVRVPAGSYLTADEPIVACLVDMDNCKSGFTITNTHSFSPLDKTGTQVVLTTGAGLEDGVRGLSLYYRDERIYCYVVTSTQVWGIVLPFDLVENSLYEITVSWHAEQGLVLLQGNNVRVSSDSLSQPTQEATITKPLLIGYQDFKESTTVMAVKDLVTSPIFWKEIKRSGIFYITETSSDTSALVMAQIIGIAVGCFAAVVIAVVAVVGLVFYIRRNSERTTSSQANLQRDGGYLSPTDSNYSMGSHSYAYYNKEATNAETSSVYDYIDDNDYVTIEP